MGDSLSGGVALRAFHTTCAPCCYHNPLPFPLPPLPFLFRHCAFNSPFIPPPPLFGRHEQWWCGVCGALLHFQHLWFGSLPICASFNTTWIYVAFWEDRDMTEKGIVVACDTYYHGFAWWWWCSFSSPPPLSPWHCWGIGTVLDKVGWKVRRQPVGWFFCVCVP